MDNSTSSHFSCVITKSHWGAESVHSLKLSFLSCWVPHATFSACYSGIWSKCDFENSAYFRLLPGLPMSFNESVELYELTLKVETWSASC